MSSTRSSEPLSPARRIVIIDLNTWLPNGGSVVCAPKSLSESNMCKNHEHYHAPSSIDVVEKGLRRARLINRVLVGIWYAAVLGFIAFMMYIGFTSHGVK